ncbi:MAG TPA: hypothetical protein P5119_05640 [Candidatus Aminicenantes bacterium]|nr:hypothetical protein [Candidatus Aminicenantes bacterium]HRY64806.1 hypothetical protein [Candidatus Aminicenantes bacterium]HRZ71719.1 hypothetical protein [Candidatus Aminicenantes bacterium]
MKLGTKVAVFLVAALLSLAGFGILIDALSADRIMASARPTAEFGVTIKG